MRTGNNYCTLECNWIVIHKGGGGGEREEGRARKWNNIQWIPPQDHRIANTPILWHIKQRHKSAYSHTHTYYTNTTHWLGWVVLSLNATGPGHKRQRGSHSKWPCNGSLSELGTPISNTAWKQTIKSARYTTPFCPDGQQSGILWLHTHFDTVVHVWILLPCI